MTYQVSKYDAIKAILKAKDQHNRLADDLLVAVRRAARHEIKTNNYKGFYLIDEQEKMLFEKASVTIHLLLEEENE